MADPVSTSGTCAATPDAGPSRDEQDRPAALLVMPMRAAEQHVLVVVGEADLHTAGQLRTQLITMIRAQPPSVLVELGALEFCDLHGLDALHDAARAAHEAGVALTFRGMSAQLAWLHHTFPPRGLVPPPSTPGRAQPAPDPSAPDARSSTMTAPAPGRPGAQNARGPRTRAALRTRRTWTPPDEPRRRTLAQRAPVTPSTSPAARPTT